MSNLIDVICLSELFESMASCLPLADAAGGFDLKEALKWFLKLDDKLKELIQAYGVWTHLILFAVIFCETGLVVTPFLPGDSLLFAAGAFAADGSLNISWLVPLLIIAAIVGDTVNYFIGHLIGERAFSGAVPFLKKAHLDKTHAYFEKYGATTIIVARFVPIVRTFAPFVAGVGAMNYRRFFFYNIVGGIFWVLIFLYAGFWFGKTELVQKNFELVMVAIVLISVLPIAWEWVSLRLSRKKSEVDAKSADVRA